MKKQKNVVNIVSIWVYASYRRDQMRTKEPLKAESGNDICIKINKVENPKATVLINHGFAEHLGRYDYVSEKLNEAGYNVYRYDLRGHGRSGSEKGHIDSYREFIDDLKEMVEIIKSAGEDDIFMLGHSMGGLITFIYGIEFQDILKGQILSGAAVGTLPAAKGYKSTVFKIANTFLKYKMIKNPVSDDICSVAEVVENYKEDPLVLEEATMNFYVEFLINAANYASENIKMYNYPCLIIHGEEDTIVPKEISENIYNSISSEDKEIKIYDGLYHEILNENERDIVISDIITWMDERV